MSNCFLKTCKGYNQNNRTVLQPEFIRAGVQNENNLIDKKNIIKNLNSNLFGRLAYDKSDIRTDIGLIGKQSA